MNEAVAELVVGGQLPLLHQMSIKRYYNSTCEGEFEKDVDGWNVKVKNEHLWETHTGSGCERTIVFYKEESTQS